MPQAELVAQADLMAQAELVAKAELMGRVELANRERAAPWSAFHLPWTAAPGTAVVGAGLETMCP